MVATFIFRASLLCMLCSSLLGCAGNTSLLTDNVRAAFQSSPADITVGQVLNPSFRYLRVTADGRSFLMILGYVDTDTTTGEPIDVWYSGQGEVLRLKNGRLVGLTTTAESFRAQWQRELPRWTELALNKSDNLAVHFDRLIDTTENYRFGLVQQAYMKLEAPPRHLKPAGTQRIDQRWLKESYKSTRSMQSSWFALMPSNQFKTDWQVFYSFQCVSEKLCFELQDWTPEDHAAQKMRVATP